MSWWFSKNEKKISNGGSWLSDPDPAWSAVVASGWCLIRTSCIIRRLLLWVAIVGLQIYNSYYVHYITGHICLFIKCKSLNSQQIRRSEAEDIQSTNEIVVFWCNFQWNLIMLNMMTGWHGNAFWRCCPFVKGIHWWQTLVQRHCNVIKSFPSFYRHVTNSCSPLLRSVLIKSRHFRQLGAMTSITMTS